jgi:dimethylargininase
MLIPFGVSSMVAPLDHVLIQSPTAAFANAFDNPDHGYFRTVEFDAARKEHELFAGLLTDLGCTIHQLEGASSSPDLIYTYDPSFVTPRGAILLRSGKPTRRGEESAHAAWYGEHEIPIIGSIDEPATVDGGDLLWLGDDLLIAGRSLRTNQAGIDQVVELVDATVLTFDVPVHSGAAACLHLMSSLSMAADHLAVVESPLLPAGLFRLLQEREVEMVEIPVDEVDSLGGNVLAVRPGVVVVVDGNPTTRALLESKGVEVHPFEGSEIAMNGSGGPTCLTRPICRN